MLYSRLILIPHTVAWSHWLSFEDIGEKSEFFLMIFDIENWLWNSDFGINSSVFFHLTYTDFQTGRLKVDREDSFFCPFIFKSSVQILVTTKPNIVIWKLNSKPFFYILF